jgi:hypothetical protein
MVSSQPAEPITLDASPIRQRIGTFPDKLIRLRDRLLAEAKTHPSFSLMSDEERTSVVENRLWSLMSNYPWWYTPGKKRRSVPTVKGELPEGLKRYHELQRMEKQEREERVRERTEATATA